MIGWFKLKLSKLDIIYLLKSYFFIIIVNLNKYISPIVLSLQDTYVQGSAAAQDTNVQGSAAARQPPVSLKEIKLLMTNMAIPLCKKTKASKWV